MAMNLSLEQQNIKDFFLASKEGILVVASAGSGKTTLLEQLAKSLSPTATNLFLAFNKTIAETLKTRLPVYCNPSTFHGVGVAACRTKFPRIRISEDKTFFAARDLGVEKQNLHRVCALVSKAKTLGYGIVSTLTTELFTSVLEETYPDWEVASLMPYVEQLLDLSVKDEKHIDFGDMLWLPIKHDWRLPRVSYIFVDEAQDLNELQMLWLERLLLPGGRIIAVGDPSQSIYAFRGAHAFAMQEMKQKFSLVTMPLSVSYRCSQAVVRLAQSYDSSSILC